MPSIPALPLLAFTRRNASFRLSLTYFLHQSTRIGWAFGVMSRQTRFSLFPPRFAGFTRWRGREVQFKLDILLLVAPEIHVVLATPLVRTFSHRFRLGLSVDSAFRHWSASLACDSAGGRGKAGRNLESSAPISSSWKERQATEVNRSDSGVSTPMTSVVPGSVRKAVVNSGVEPG